MQLPHTFTSSMQRSSSTVGTGIKATIVALVIINLVQLNLLFLGTNSSLSSYWRCGSKPSQSSGSLPAIAPQSPNKKEKPAKGLWDTLG